MFKLFNVSTDRFSAIASHSSTCICVLLRLKYPPRSYPVGDRPFSPKVRPYPILNLTRARSFPSKSAIALI
ncbi:hypothetical protein QUA44_30790 [Microcoleus sp. N9_A2]|uniref:hypothetical protein n=1 Tax=unclassified Microcoleus TaxID=2642155 RepID=UPI002FD21DD6